MVVDSQRGKRRPHLTFDDTEERSRKKHEDSHREEVDDSRWGESGIKKHINFTCGYVCVVQCINKLLFYDTRHILNTQIDIKNINVIYIVYSLIYCEVYRYR